jgi:hypothetical protein
MRRHTLSFFSGLILITQTSFISLSAEEAYNESDIATPQETSELSTTPFTAFTGKITKNKVRLRLQPNLDSPIIKELAQGDMLIINGETEDFYAVQPPSGLKGYVFRTYILDNVVEATRVNVRLEPELEAPILAQLHAGDHIEGTVSALNSKWLEIIPPASAHFYVAKDYVEKIGDASAMGKLEKQRTEVNMLLNTTYLASQTEMQKSFPEINLESVYANYNKIINHYKGYPEQVARAKEQLSSLQDSYLQKKIAYLEAKTKIVQDDWQIKNSQLSDQMKAQQQKMSHLEQQLKKTKDAPPFVQNIQNPGISHKMAAWLPVEHSLYQEWLKSNENRSQEEYYEEQNQSAVALRGIVEPYTRVIKNKPGDYILVNQSNHLPIAYLYSTHVNLQDRVGHEVTIYGVPRDNRSFAFPAYFVLSLE